MSKWPRIILAAGESRRMGRPKALLPFRGGTFISVLAGNPGQFCSPVYAVFGFDAEQLMTQMRRRRSSPWRIRITGREC